MRSVLLSAGPSGPGASCSDSEPLRLQADAPSPALSASIGPRHSVPFSGSDVWRSVGTAASRSRPFAHLRSDGLGDGTLHADGDVVRRHSAVRLVPAVSQHVPELGGGTLSQLVCPGDLQIKVQNGHFVAKRHVPSPFWGHRPEPRPAAKPPAEGNGSKRHHDAEPSPPTLAVGFRFRPERGTCNLGIVQGRDGPRWWPHKRGTPAPNAPPPP
jgi:hypothetical protein